MKKIIAILLCLTLAFSSASVLGFAVAAPVEENDVNAETLSGTVDSQADYPIVFVTGIGQSYSYFYENIEDAKNYYNLLEQVENGTAPKGVRETDGAKCRWNLFCNDFSFAFKEYSTYPALLKVVFGLLASKWGVNLVPRKAVDKIVNKLFRYNIINEFGNLPANVVTPKCYKPVSCYTEEQRENFYRAIPCQEIVDGIGEDMLYCFNYSAFSFTYDNAKDLDDFIDNYVLGKYNKTGADKVVLIPMSMGASVVSAYLQQYGTKAKVKRVVSIVGAWDGSDVFADLIEQKYADNAPDLLYNGIISELVGEPWGYLVNIILRIFPKSVLRSIIDEILGSVVDNLVMKTPSLLALIPHDRYMAIRKQKLENNEELAYIIRQTDKYYQCQCGLEERLKMLHDDYGVDFYYLAGYGLQFGGFSSDYKFFQFMKSSATTNSDEIIQISSTATGASYLPYNSADKFEAGEYVTPDGRVDISTCFFKDNVWLFEGQKHELENNNTALRLAFDLACGKTAEAGSYSRFNGSRDLKKLNRDYLPALQDYLGKGNTLTPAQQEVYDSVIAMKNSKVNNRAEDDAKIQALYDMMCDLGIYEKSEPKGETEDSFLKKANDWVYNVFGAKGFVDYFKK